MKGTVLVLFGDKLPEKGEKWWEDLSVIVARKHLHERIPKTKAPLIDLDELLLPGSVQDAEQLVRNLAVMKVKNGGRLSKQVMYKGYELWWTHYDDLYYKFCVPYTQYHTLLSYLKDFEKVTLYQPPDAALFRYYLQAYRRPCEILDSPSPRVPPLSLWLQLLLSVPFWLWLLVRKPPLMIWTSDLFDPPRDHDYRYRFVYEEIYKKNISFVEFIRSQERWSVLLRHAWVRRRPVIYSHAISVISRFVAGLFTTRYTRMLTALNPATTPEDDFWYAIATSYLRTASGDIWAIAILNIIVRSIGIRAAIPTAHTSRNFNEALAYKIANVPSVGILQGASSKSYVAYDFVPDYDGEKTLSVDRYGVWSSWWKEYYTTYSKIYKPEQLFVSGPMRPVARENISQVRGEKLKVLFASEQLAAPQEVVPYLDALLAHDDMEVYFKFRSYRDRFEEWLLAHRPDVLKKIPRKQILMGTMGEAVAACDVVVGSHSTGVLEALLHARPFVFFKSKKWGDYFELESYDSPYSFIAHTPEELLTLVRKSSDIPEAELLKLQRRFFGDPHENGSAWVVGEVEKLLADKKG